MKKGDGSKHVRKEGRNGQIEEVKKERLREHRRAKRRMQGRKEGKEGMELK